MLMLAMVSLSGCKKDEYSEPPAPTVKTFELRFTCISDNPYKVEVAGKSNIISGHSYKTYDLKQDTYSWKFTQQSGYLFYPTIQEGTLTLDQDKEIVFP